MRKLSSTFGILAAALAVATPVLAVPRAPSMAPAGLVHADQSPAPQPNHRAQGMAGPGRSDQPPLPIGLELAAKLSALEVYVGIRGDQEDAWRGYTSSLIALFDRPMPMPREGGQAPDGIAEDAPQDQDAPPLMSERLAADAIERGEAARALQEAIAELRTTLDSDQFNRLASVERSLAAPPGPGGPAHPPMMGPGAGRGDHPQPGPRPTPPSPTDR